MNDQRPPDSGLEAGERLDPLPPARWRPALATVVCLAAGVMLTTALPPARGTAVLAPLALAVLFHYLRHAPGPGRLALAFGVGHAGTLMSWLFFLDPAKSIPTRALVPAQAVAAILFVAIHFGLLGLVVGRLRRRLPATLVLALLPVLWALLELLRSVGELGFPWCLVGTAWLETPLAPLYAAAGEIGMGAATALLAAMLVMIADRIRGVGRRDRRWAPLTGACVLAWLLLWWGSRPLTVDPVAGQRTTPLQVACVQANVAQADKWQDATIDSTRIPYQNLTARAAAEGADLVIWAETAIPAYVRFDRAMLDWVRGVARSGAVPILAGFPDARRLPAAGDDGKSTLLKYNAAGLFSREGTLVDTYGKHHLVPIGESMPFQRWLPALGKIDVGQAEWTNGDPPGPMTVTTPEGDVELACLICFEAAFGELARGAVRRGATVLVNITNDGWFGYSAGPRQHAALARIRAIECGVPLVRCANNGISMICGPDGRVREQLGLRQRGLVTASVTAARRGTWYLRTGRWPVYVYLGLWTLVAVIISRRRYPDRKAGP